MAGTVGQPDSPAALAGLLSDLNRRLARLETQNRLRDATIDAPGLLRYRDAAGVVRFALGGFDNGGIGTQQYGPDGAVLTPAVQAANGAPALVTSTLYADAGPALTTSVTAGPSGSLLVILSALLVATDRTVTSSALMSFTSTGGRVTAAQDGNALQVSDAAQILTTGAASTGTAHTHPIDGAAATATRASRVVLVPGCDPNVPVVLTAKYRVTAGSWTVDDRSLLVIPL